MTDKQNVQETSPNPEKEGASSPAGVDLSKYVAVEDFRKYQAKKDKEVAEANRRVEEAERRIAQEREEYLRVLGEHPEVKDNLELAQLRTKAARLDQMEEERARLTTARQQYATLFGVSAEALADAETPAEIVAKARQLEKEQLVADLRKQLGIRETASEEKEPPEVPVSKGPPPDATLVSESEFERRMNEAAELAKTGTKKRDRETARLEYLKRATKRPPARQVRV